MVVEVGSGEDDFAQLEEGDPLELVYGSQGGYHVWGGVRATGVAGVTETAPAALAWWLYLAGSPVGGIANVRFGPDQVVGELLDRAGVTVFVESPRVVSGRDARLEVELTDGCGREAVEGIDVHVAELVEP